MDELLESPEKWKLCQTEARAQEEKFDRKYLISWPRKIGFTPFAKQCQYDEEEDVPPTSSSSSLFSVLRPVPETADRPLEDVPFPEEDIFKRKARCVMTAAKYGLKEGVLSGIFFGGGWGIYRYIDLFYLNADKYEKGNMNGISNGGNRSNSRGPNINDSFINKNIIFVSACNSAIFLGVICTLICGTRASLTCS